mmetsp:Transcript_7611/g.18673  ORF Transcript_7611/g.18673 Transcript_7611/m.18673 type:complete len:652 (-) Transcript_7611:91-2046(-)
MAPPRRLASKGHGRKGGNNVMSNNRAARRNSVELEYSSGDETQNQNDDASGPGTDSRLALSSAGPMETEGSMAPRNKAEWLMSAAPAPPDQPALDSRRVSDPSAGTAPHIELSSVAMAPKGGRKVSNATTEPTSTKTPSDQQTPISVGTWNGQKWREQPVATKDRTWMMFLCGIGRTGDDHDGFDDSKLINPGSPFAIVWVLLTTVFLLYTAFWTPVSVSFYWNLDVCEPLPTLEFDVFIDCWFSIDLIMNFIMGVYSDGNYEDSFRAVAKKYIQGMFVFDLCTTVPVGLIEYVMLLGCVEGDEAGYSVLSVRFTRVMKPLRLIKLIRLFKILRNRNIVNHLSSVKSEPPPAVVLGKVFILVFAMVHVCACIFWLIKQVGSSEAEYEGFLEDQGLESSSSVESKYVVAIYFISTIVTTVGFGDIAGLNSWERLFCIFIMFIGSVIFGYLLASIQEIVMKMDRYAEERASTQEMLDWLRRRNIPAALREKVVHWIAFQYRHEEELHNQDKHLDKLLEAPALYKEMLEFLHGGLLERISFLGGLKHELKGHFLLELWREMMAEAYYKDTILMCSGEPNKCLLIVTCGDVRVMGADGTALDFVEKGGSIGSEALLGEGDIGKVYGRSDIFVVAMTNVSALVLKRYAELCMPGAE